MDTQFAPVPVASRRMSFDTAAAWALSLTGVLAVIAFLPFGSLSFFATKVFLITLGAIVSLALFILARLTRGNVILPPLSLVGALWLVPLAYALSTLFSGRPMSASLYGVQFESDTFGFILLLAVIATLAALTFRRAEHYRALFLGSAASYVLVIAFQIVFLLSSKLFPNVIGATTNLVGSFIDLGVFVALGVVLALMTLRFALLTRPLTISLSVGAAVGLFILALVNSTLLWVLVGLVAFAFFIEGIMKRAVSNADGDVDGEYDVPEATVEPASAGNAHMLLPSLAVLVVSVFFLLGNSLGNGTVGQTFAGALGVSVVTASPSWQGTFAIASQTYKDAALFGSGPGTFGLEWLRHRDAKLNTEILWNVDFASGIGWIPTSFVTTGIFGAIMWVLFLGLFLFLGTRFLLFRAPSDESLRFVSLSSFVASLFLLTVAIFTVPGPAVLAVMFLAIGIFVSTTRFAGERRERGIVFARNPRLGFMLVFVLTIVLLASVGQAYVVISRYLADVSYNRAGAALTAGDVAGAYALAERSAVFAESTRAYGLIAATALTEMANVVADETLSPETARETFQQALSRGVDAAITATRLSPDDYQAWVLLGQVYQAVVPLEIEGAYANAKAAYERAIELHPTSPVLPLTLAQLEIANGDLAAAEEYLKAAISLKNNYTEAIFVYSQLQASQGKAAEALATAEAAAFLASGDATVQFQVGILRSATGDNAGAVAALSRAVELNPQYANALFFLGVAYALQNQFENALAALEKAAALSPENAEALKGDIETLRAGQNPFPPSRLGALGVAPAAVEDDAAARQ